jgi:CheY-like chemotaxis protein
LLAYAGGGQFVVETHDLAALVDEMQDLLRAAAGHIRLRFTTVSPCPVKGDAGQLRQILINFVLNAAEAIDDQATGEINLSVKLDSSDPGAPRVELEVRDNGRGMSPDVQRRILEPFFTTKTLGRGLGLAAVSGIVRSHGGELRVRSELEKGTTFTVRFPAVPMVDPVPRRVSSSPKAAAGAKLLLVDDNDNFRRMCASLLADLGYLALDMARGDEAIAHVRASMDDVDAVVLDWTMPAPGGAETFARLRELRADLPIVIMSGYAEAAATALTREGPTAFLEKPFTPDALDAAVRSVLG